jgi:hypothetical protein
VIQFIMAEPKEGNAFNAFVSGIYIAKFANVKDK